MLGMFTVVMLGATFQNRGNVFNYGPRSTRVLEKISFLALGLGQR